MAKRDDIIAFCDDLLAVGEVRDSLPIGLQVEGAEEVTKIVTGVSACLELFEEAARRGAQMVIVHHGMFWDGESRVIRGVRKARIKTLIENEITLLGYHLPLDRNLYIGNNAQIALRLGLRDVEPFGVYHDMAIGVKGKLSVPCASADMIGMLTRVIGVGPLAYEYGNPQIRTVGIVSGGAADLVEQAVDQRLDAYVTGEAGEPTMNYCREAGIHFFACGHYHSERVGVQALGEKVARQFDIPVEFVEVANEV